MPFGKELVRITNYLRIAWLTITGKPILSYPEDSRYRIEVHIPGRTFEPRTEPMEFKFIAPNWILGRDIVVHCALGIIKEEYTDHGGMSIKQPSLRELDLEDEPREAHYEHELEVADFLERIKKLKSLFAYLEEELDMGENLHPE
ncbi:hypothetical protein D1007_12378 [Hordeum vulgare]|nr:hypothetical protein D1007_12378 [Hordeum vulgare]